jgi:hypothetical protein
MKKGETRITIGAAMAVGLISLVIAAAILSNQHLGELAFWLIFFGIPAVSTALIISGIFKRLDDRENSN